MEPPLAFDRLIPRAPMILAALYLPYSWLLLLDGPWDSYRWHWLRMLPVLPGLLVHAIPGVHQQPDWLSYLLMAAATLLILVVVASFCQLGRRVSIAVALVAGILSVANSWIAYHLYHL